jgi:MFS family permease
MLFSLSAHRRSEMKENIDIIERRMIMRLSSRIALLCLSVTASFAPMLAAPAVKLLKIDFPSTDALFLQWVVTLSSFFILPTLFMVSYLSRKFSRKFIILTGLVLYLIGGVGPAFMNSIPTILVFRAILGLGIGLISPTFNALIAENFQGLERSRMYGWVTAINGIGGAIFLSIGGFIASYGWRSVFFSYSYAALLLILVLFFMPKFPPVRNNEPSINHSTIRIPRIFYAIALASGLHVMLYFTVPTSISLYLAENGIGTSATVGYLTALSLIGVFLAGLFITRLTRLFKRGLIPFGFVLFGLGFLLESLAHSVWMVAIALFLIGMAEGIFYLLSFNKTAEVVPKERMTTAFSMLLAVIYTLQFLCPLFLKGIQSLFQLSSNRETFMFLAIAMGVSMVISMLFVSKAKVRQLAH